LTECQFRAQGGFIVLSGIRVVDRTDERGFLAGKILADLGADVIKVEPPAGDPARREGPFLGGVEHPERSLLWLALNTSKRGVSLDLDAAEGREAFLALVDTSDVVLDSRPPSAMAARGLDAASLRATRPRLVTASITPFGESGPHAEFTGGDLVVVAMGGNASMTGDPERPPLRCSMPTSIYHAAPEAALGVLMALHAREDTGVGQHVDVSMQECQLGTLLSGPGQFAIHGRLGRRAGARLGRTREIWRAADGDVSFGLRGGPARVPNLEATVAYMEECGMAPAWLRDYDWSSYEPGALTDQELSRLEDAFAAFFASKTRRELYDEALRRRILLAPCNDAREILDHPQLRDRELFVRIDYPELGASIEHPDFFARVLADDGAGVRVRRRAPRIGEHNREVFQSLAVGS
jgi:crotonobetainyl-CoA:carnitine CoA-transferase CaiB-like acyl-CoA transferase